MMGFLSTKSDRIVDGEGREVFLRGYGIGGWLVHENYITGIPGTEQDFRRKLRVTAGDEKSARLFEALADHFVRESDVAFMKDLGVNAIRVPFNYRNFEQDLHPYQYAADGFRFLDRFIAWCKEHGIYVILDMHAVQGYQMGAWPADNPAGEVRLFGDRLAQDRFCKVWQHIADHYKDEPAVAGYELMNEPDARGAEATGWLNVVYRECTRAIRSVDKRHIIFLEGNAHGSDFNGLDEPFTENLVYSFHFYPRPTFPGALYNSVIDGELYDKAALVRGIDQRAEFIKKCGVPCWVGEFGPLFPGGEENENKARFVSDMLDVFNERGFSWHIWTYKDLGLQGVRFVRPDSDWSKFLDGLGLNKARQRLNCDVWQFVDAGSWDHVQRIIEWVRPDLPPPALELKRSISLSLDRIFSAVLLDKLVHALASLADSEIQALARSFSFELCETQPHLERVLSSHLKPGC